MAGKNVRTINDLVEEQPGLETEMQPKPHFEYVLDGLRGGRLKGKVSVITGGDSGIGRAVSVAYAAEGAEVIILYKERVEEKDAENTHNYIKKKYKKTL